MPVTVAFVHEQFAFFPGARPWPHRRCSVDFYELVVDGLDFSSISKTDSADLASRDGAKSRAVRILAAVGIAALFTIIASDPSSSFFAGIGGSLRFALACWGVFALPIILGDAIYINLHPLVVVGQLLDWLSTSLLATVITAWWRNR